MLDAKRVIFLPGAVGSSWKLSLMVPFYEDDFAPFLPKLFVKFFGKESCRVGAITLVWEIFT
jgi:hypothetical protein